MPGLAPGISFKALDKNKAGTSPALSQKQIVVNHQPFRDGLFRNGSVQLSGRAL